MQAFTLETTVARPRELVYDYLADVAHHPEFLDHFLKEWHMTREETFGLGAGGCFRAEVPFQRFPWGDWAIVQLESPHRIVLHGRTGKFNRVRTLTAVRLLRTPGTPAAALVTRTPATCVARAGRVLFLDQRGAPAAGPDPRGGSRSRRARHDRRRPAQAGDEHSSPGDSCLDSRPP